MGGRGARSKTATESIHDKGSREFYEAMDKIRNSSDYPKNVSASEWGNLTKELSDETVRGMTEAEMEKAMAVNRAEGQSSVAYWNYLVTTNGSNSSFDKEYSKQQTLRTNIAKLDKYRNLLTTAKKAATKKGTLNGKTVEYKELGFSDSSYKKMYIQVIKSDVKGYKVGTIKEVSTNSKLLK